MINTEKIMSDIIRKCTGIFLLAVLLLLVFSQIGTAAKSSVSVVPQTITASHGDTFTIDIMVDPAGSRVFGAEYKLFFDRNLLKAIDQSRGTLLSQDGAEVIEVVNKINNTIGIIEYGETRTGEAGVTSSGVLASITFEVIGSGTSELRLEAMLADPDAQPIDTVVKNGTCTAGGWEAGHTPIQTPTSTAASPSQEKRAPVPGAVFAGLSLAAVWILRKQ
jgi:hypothetical protein